MSKRFTLWSVSLLAAVSLSETLSAQGAFYHIEIRNMDPQQVLSPPLAVVHESGYQLFSVGNPATPGLESLAEEGQANTLLEETNSDMSVHFARINGSGPSPTGFKFIVEGQPNQLFSLASMFGRTNDIFVGVASTPLPAGITPITVDASAYDAGTEINSGVMADIPFYGNSNVGMTESGTVQPIMSYMISDDPGGVLNFSWPPAAQVVITPMPNAIEYEITIRSADERQPISPPVIVTHKAGYDMFSSGNAASPGLEMVAEEGNPNLLADEARGNMDVYTVTVGQKDADGTYTTSVVGMPESFLSFAEMLGRTNDIFTGLDAMMLPPAGPPVMIDTMAYDAGTETNTGMMAHIPFYGNMGGPTEGSVVMAINTYQIVDDPAGVLTFNWPPAAHVTITPKTAASSVAHWELME